MNIFNVLLIGLGGFIGTVVRYVTVKIISSNNVSGFPWGTFTVNFSGSLLLGFIMGLAASRKGDTDSSWVLFLTVGVCGGFTTFSAFAYENYNLLQDRPATGIAYIIATIAAGVAAVAGGMALARSL